MTQLHRCTTTATFAQQFSSSDRKPWRSHNTMLLNSNTNINTCLLNRFQGEIRSVSAPITNCCKTLDYYLTTCTQLLHKQSLIKQIYSQQPIVYAQTKNIISSWTSKERSQFGPHPPEGLPKGWGLFVFCPLLVS